MLEDGNDYRQRLYFYRVLNKHLFCLFFSSCRLSLFLRAVLDLQQSWSEISHIFLLPQGVFWLLRSMMMLLLLGLHWHIIRSVLKKLENNILIVIKWLPIGFLDKLCIFHPRSSFNQVFVKLLRKYISWDHINLDRLTLSNYKSSAHKNVFFIGQSVLTNMTWLSTWWWIIWRAGVAMMQEVQFIFSVL